MTPSAVPEKINKSLNPLRSDKSTHCHFVQFPKQMRSYASSHFRFTNFIFSREQCDTFSLTQSPQNMERSTVFLEQESTSPTK